MIPNTFEAGVLINKDIKNTTLFLAQVQKWAGVDTDTPQKFTELNNKDHIQTLGVIYEGFKDITIQAWQYNLKNFEVNKISYIEANYETSINDTDLELSTQYSLQNHTAPLAKKATILGFNASLGFKNSGITLSGSYNKTSNNSAINGFGGGPFFTSSQHLTIEDMGISKATNIGILWDTSIIGISNLTLSLNALNIKNQLGKKATEKDFVATYEVNDNLTVDLIYSNIDDKINNEKFKNTRVFANYSF